MVTKQKQIVPQAKSHPSQMVFAGAAGLFFFVAILKFGDPVILDNLIQPPDGLLGAVFETWQVKWGYLLLVPLIIAGLAAVRWDSLKFRWALLLPLVWLGWNFLSAIHSVSPSLSTLTLQHFSACVVLFYLGYFGLQGMRNPWPLWAGIGLAVCWIIRIGFDQHFGGLEATRHFVESMKNDPSLSPGALNDPAYQRRIAGTRIFATFSNSDSLAAAMELFLPVTLFFLWQLSPKLRPRIRTVFVIILGGCGLACLFWSGSKAGWLVALVLGMIALWHSTLPVKWKKNLIFGVLAIGILGFAARYASTYKKQQVSVGTRIAYWKAALQITGNHPVFGTGPGTFSVPYAQIKRPEDDFARLCHNDYLEQACDSGFPAFLAFTTMVLGSLGWLYRYRFKDVKSYNYKFLAWLGTVGLALHCTVDYHLYVPALAWPMFFFLGFSMNFID